MASAPTQRIRRAEEGSAESNLDRTLDVDVIGDTVISEKSLREMVANASDVASRWGVATSIQTEDFVEAVRAAGVISR